MSKSKHSDVKVSQRVSCFTRCVVWGSGEIELCAQDDEITARQSAAHKPNSFMADSATSTAFTLANIKLSLTVNWILAISDPEL